MGKRAVPPPPPGPPQYRDDPDAVSLHTTPSDYAYDDVPDLPSYSDSEAAATSSNSRTAAENTTLVDTYAAIPEASPSGWRMRSTQSPVVTGAETTIRMDARLADPKELHNYLTNCLSLLPPQIQVRLRGWHSESVHRNNKRETDTVVDFDMAFSLADYLPSGPHEPGWQSYLAVDSDSAYRGGWRKTRPPGRKQDIEIGGEQPLTFEIDGEEHLVALNQGYLDLMRWIREYCDSPATLKSFRLTREVAGLDTEYLRTALERLVRSTDYRGHVSVSFPVADKHVDIYNPHWANRWRTSAVRYVFYFTFLWLLTWPILFFMTKRWEIYTIRWCYSINRPFRAHGQDGVEKVYTRLSEQGWFERHANLIRGLALDRFQGDATNLPLNAGNAEERRRSGARQTGNANVDAAVSLVQGGLDVWNSVQRGGRREAGAWGGDS
ncbi:hypothetical protein LTR53_008218 [Teratosphaeriaceae sp. CCFEE 6253]|nr:hypothetical protein LTR53_008218 [Teratosphaeriaceae sp. CCFEE 6253]